MFRLAILLIAACATFTICAPRAAACWAAPDPVVWGDDSGGGAYEYKRDNATGTITVYAKGQRGTALWSATLEGFSGLFSEVYLVADGTKIVHVRSNHQVSRLNDTAVSIYTRTGAKHLAAREFVSAIEMPAPDQPRDSTDPGRYWLAAVKSVSATKLVLVTHDNRSHTVAI